MRKTYQFRIYPTLDVLPALKSEACAAPCAPGTVKNHHLARSIHDASWGMLINYTTYKAEYAGGAVELVNPRNTSKQCSICGNIQPMPLSQRTYRCPVCGNVMGRDHNAAINIHNRYVRADCAEFTPVEILA